MAPWKSRQQGPQRPATPRLHVTPTPELQGLYDELRRAEEEAELSRLHSPSSTGKPTGSAALLQPESLAQAMSRSPSSASYNSTGQCSTDADDLDDGCHSETRTKRRAIRRQPLDKVRKARAALVRKLGACTKCRARRVSCDHYDLSLLRSAYDARQDLPCRAAQPLGNPSGLLAALPQPSSASRAVQYSHPPPVDNKQRDIDLRGVSANPANALFHLPSPTYNTGDRDILSQTQPVWPSIASSDDDLRPFFDIPSQPVPRPGRRRSLLVGPSAILDPPAGNLTRDTEFLPIGRQVDTVRDIWECQWGRSSAGTGSVASFTEDGAGCLKHCRNVDELVSHYHQAHGLFDVADQPFMWKCMSVSCEFLNDRRGPCPQCRQLSPLWETWYYGLVPVSGRIISPPGTSVQTSDQASSFGASLGRGFSSYGYGGYSGFTSFTDACYSAQSGTDRSYLQRYPGPLPELVSGAALLIALLYLSLLTISVALASSPTPLTGVYNLDSLCARMRARRPLRLTDSWIQVGAWCLRKIIQPETMRYVLLSVMIVFLGLRALVGSRGRQWGRLMMGREDRLVHIQA